MRIEGSGGLRGGTVDSHGDHRIAMLGAIAGLASKQGVEVEGMEAAAISYPGFEADLASLSSGGRDDPVSTAGLDVTTVGSGPRSSSCTATSSAPRWPGAASGRWPSAGRLVIAQPARLRRQPAARTRRLRGRGAAVRRAARGGGPPGRPLLRGGDRAARRGAATRGGAVADRVRARRAAARPPPEAKEMIAQGEALYAARGSFTPASVPAAVPQRGRLGSRDARGAARVAAAGGRARDGRAAAVGGGGADGPAGRGRHPRPGGVGRPLGRVRGRLRRGLPRGSGPSGP